MYFKKLEIVGFKSFADKTTLHFEPGITAIVGPNGCGKSNIFDSIRWVLGEQSIKELRGSQSQDVIFNGSDAKEPLGMAEVTLTFDNTNKHFEVDNNDVAITRRIFRSGESEYLLNKQQVRLKDILDLLLGTGIGAESYSLVQQGKIDLVLSSRPEDRRLVFDEASGITKYKSQKKEALRKLEETQQNLLRINDIIIEVKRQIGSLERQANKARRYKEVFDELKKKEIDLAIFQKIQIDNSRLGLVEELKGLQLQEAGILEAIRQQQENVESRRNELKEMEDAINAVRNEILALENRIQANKQRQDFNRERIVELGERKKYLQEQLELKRNSMALDEEKLNTLKNEFSHLQKNIDEKSAVLMEKEGFLTSITEGIKSSLELIAATKREILEEAAKVSGLKNSLTDMSSKQQVILARKKRLEIEKAKLNEEKFTADEALLKITAEVKTLEEAFSQLCAKANELKSSLEAENLSLNNINSDIQDLENKTLVLQSHKDFLEKLNTEYEGISESMNALIYLDRLPGENLSGLVVKLKAGQENIPSQAQDTGSGTGFKLFGEAKPIDMDTGKIQNRIEELQHKIDSLKVIKRLKESNIEGFKKEISNMDAGLRKEEIGLSDKRAVQKNILEQADKLKAEEEVILLELTDADNELRSIEDTSAVIREELAQLEKIMKDSEERILTEQNKINSNNILKEETLVMITQVKTEKDALIKRLDSDKDTLKILEDTYNQNKNVLNDFQAQIDQCEEKRTLLEREIEDSQKENRDSSSEIEKLGLALKERESQYDKLNEDSSRSLQGIDQRKEELETVKNKLYDLQMQNKDLEFKYLSLKERISQGYKMDLDTFNQLPEGEIDFSALQGEIDKLKEKLDSYGNVNLVAIEEYDELKKRYDFLTQQQNDLNTAREALHNAILKINRTTKQMFLETFEKVKVEFRNYFRMLFNGGDAQLFLTDEQDPLESGIEIICRPPGKKLQNVLLLSGGEKSLSATALIFAIFRIKPAPFCVLDEIDAALDEANVDRFSKMLHEFSNYSQFIVITHNKKTIANADVMYGITMQESGVSRIVSVKFAQNKATKPQEPDLASGVADAVAGA
ncbi:MAG: AAA family ATPase [Candidatus Omnitrophica bacterium]|nr:AAA family ATPase [Candidatus Omnitrophota bacterium]MDD5512384.1 AAA family ATPase [Candidatus Omnitrophota bacterium]